MTGGLLGGKLSSWRVFALGQVLSFLVTGTGVCSSILAARGMSFPMLQLTFTYFLLSSRLLRGRRGRGLAGHSPTRWWKYALVALVDLEANFLLVLAYRYTSIASVMLLDCATVPCVMILSRYVLNARYNAWHAFGVCICVLGLACAITSDWLCAEQSRPRDSSALPETALRGDVLTLVGALLYAVSNTAQELLVKQHGRREFLGSVGGYGALFGLLQFALLESEATRHSTWHLLDVGLLAAFTLSMYGFYVLTSLFIQQADAALLTLSLLTSDIYAIVYATLGSGQRFCWLYLVGFGLTLSGVVIFSCQEMAPRADEAYAEDGSARMPLALQTVPLEIGQQASRLSEASMPLSPSLPDLSGNDLPIALLTAG